MKRIIKLTESDLARIVKRVINEQDEKVYELPDVNIYNTNGYMFNLKKPTSDGYKKIYYDIKTGKILGISNQNKRGENIVIMRTQQNKPKEWVIDFLKKNNISIIS